MAHLPPPANASSNGPRDASQAETMSTGRAAVAGPRLTSGGTQHQPTLVTSGHPPWVNAPDEREYTLPDEVTAGVVCLMCREPLGADRIMVMGGEVARCADEMRCHTRFAALCGLDLTTGPAPASSPTVSRSSRSRDAGAPTLLRRHPGLGVSRPDSGSSAGAHAGTGAAHSPAAVATLIGVPAGPSAAENIEAVYG